MGPASFGFLWCEVVNRSGLVTSHSGIVNGVSTSCENRIRQFHRITHTVTFTVTGRPFPCRATIKYGRVSLDKQEWVTRDVEQVLRPAKQWWGVKVISWHCTTPTPTPTRPTRLYILTSDTRDFLAKKSVSVLVSASWNANYNKQLNACVKIASR